MRAWTNGKTCRAWLPVGRLRLELGEESSAEFETGPDPKRKQAHAYDDHDVVAPAPKKGKDLLEEHGSPAAIDAVALDEKTLALVLAHEGKDPELWIGAPKAKKPTLSLPLRAEGARVAWPEGAIWVASAPPPWSKSEAMLASGPRSVRLSQSPHGLAVACGATGHLAVLRPGAKAFAFVLRLPGQEEATLHAIATEQGALATLVVEGRHALVLHLAEDGSILGRWPSESFAWGMSASALLSFGSKKGPQALVYDSQRESISLLRLPGLEEEQRDHLGDRVIDLSASTDGTSFVLCADPSVRLGRIDPDTERFLLDEPYSVVALVSFSRSAEATRVARYDPERATGPAQVGFPTIKETGGPWRAGVGQSFEIPILLRSAGERGEGVIVQVGGPAIDAGHIRVTHARAADQAADSAGEVALDAGGRAELPTVRLPPGLVYPLDPKPKKAEDKEVGEVALEATHFEIVLRGEGLKAGRPLFWVSVGALSGSAPVKRTRPFMVE